MLFSFCVFALLQWIKSLVIGAIGGLLITVCCNPMSATFDIFLSVILMAHFQIQIGFIAFPAANGIVTKHLSKTEQGIGFAVIYAVRSLTWIIAPIAFAETYSVFKAVGLPSMVMLFAAALLFMVVIIILFPLKRTILLTETSGRKYSFSTVELEMIDKKDRNQEAKEAAMETNDRFETLGDSEHVR